ncbi:urease accessory protein UreE [Aquisalimonas sp. 2447]|uniref:urease accessory protein UreE n=1 Tax=Aquisalimonas sp. 2447 TaxID=2740807 RepID=UPI0014325800|nr:urease accessory protein UreE [Aquisalimonas sp. 2447]QIT56945.1 urease accessory protein UreE [Aquisalimonas sp. 2447]
MLRLTEYTTAAEDAHGVLVLPFDTRQKSRFRATLQDGTEVGVFLERGRILRNGDGLRAEGGEVIRVQAANEAVSTVRCADGTTLARVAYHLGNRHVPLQIGDGFVRYRHDHVLDEMVRGLGLDTTPEQAPFEPEAGAYGGGHSHGHDHDHDHHH